MALLHRQEEQPRELGDFTSHDSSPQIFAILVGHFTNNIWDTYCKMTNKYCGDFGRRIMVFLPYCGDCHFPKYCGNMTHLLTNPRFVRECRKVTVSANLRDSPQNIHKQMRGTMRKSKLGQFPSLNFKAQGINNSNNDTNDNDTG